jgi:uncharacterized DUF497 family protein
MYGNLSIWQKPRDLRMGRCERTHQSLKHGVSFELAQHAFLDSKRVIVADLSHSGQERRYFCFGCVDGGVMTVRFTWPANRIRIIGAGYWRKGRKIYEEEND